MLQSYHQNGEQFEIMFNKTKLDTLPAKMQAIIANAVEAASATCRGRRSPLLAGLHRAADQGQGEVLKTPDSVLQGQLEIFGGTRSTAKSRQRTRCGRR